MVLSVPPSSPVAPYDMNCPSCSTENLSPVTGVCTLCGYSARTAVQVDGTDALAERARTELAHDFELHETLGRGKRTVVISATERASGRRVVLKVIDRGADAVTDDQLFRASVSAQLGFDHPHLVPVGRFGVTDSLRWFTREDIGAASLREVLASGGRFDVRAARRLATQLASALDYLHRRGVIHGALRPENVLMDRNGWAHLCDPALSYDHDGGERPSWRAPEDFTSGVRSAAADQYALAALLAECLLGEAPDDDVAAALQLDRDVPAYTTDAIVRALREEPRDRFASLGDFVWALEAGAPVQRAARPAGKPTADVIIDHEWTPPEVERRPARLILGVLAAIAAGGVIWLAVPPVLRLVRPEPVVVIGAPRTRTPAPAVTTPTEAPAPAPAAAAESPATRTSPTAPPATAATTAPVATVPTAPVAQQPARLSINAVPWGQVYVDDVFIGNTPRVNVDLAPGERRIRVVRDGYEPFASTITVSPGEAVRLTNIELVRRRP